MALLYITAKCIFFVKQKILADFVSVEMVFHAKAIEYYSQCFENLAMIDEEEDLHVSCFLCSIFVTGHRSYCPINFMSNL